MDVLLIQPNESPHPYAGKGLEYAEGRRACPAWQVLTLHMYLRRHSMHRPVLFDARVEEHPREAFKRAWRRLREPGAVVIYADALHAADALKWAAWLAEEAPEVPLLVFGPLADAFPEPLLGPGRFDAAARGDAELVLRKALDHVDNPVRLSHLAGLCVPGHPPREPFLSDSVEVLSLPDWTAVDIARYKEWFRSGVFEVDLCMARGNTDLPPDRFFGGKPLPWRPYPEDELQQTIQASSGSGASHVFLTDGPALWTPERLQRWCARLLHRQTQQVWGFRLLPTHLDDAEIEALELSLCRRIEMYLPSTDPAGLEEYGCLLNPKALKRTIERLHEVKIHVSLHFLLGRPGEPPGAGARIVRLVEALGGCDYELHPYPCWPDSPDARTHFGPDLEARVAAWVEELVHDPDRPAWFDWPDPGHVDRVLADASYVRRRTAITPMRSLKRSFSKTWNLMRHSLRGGGPEGGVKVTVD